MVQSQAASGLTIAALAREGDVGVETIRYYQRRGLLRLPTRPQQGGAIRRYDANDLRTLRFIRSAQAAGFKLDEIAELIALERRDDRARARQLARERVASLDAQIAALQLARNALAKLEHDCAATSAGPCPIFSAFEPSRDGVSPCHDA